MTSVFPKAEPESLKKKKKKAEKALSEFSLAPKKSALFIAIQAIHA